MQQAASSKRATMTRGFVNREEAGSTSGLAASGGDLPRTLTFLRCTPYLLYTDGYLQFLS